MNVLTRPITMSDNSVITQFSDSVDNGGMTYTFPTTQDHLTVWNQGISNLILNVGTYSNIVILPNQKWSNDVSFALISLSSIISCDIDIIAKVSGTNINNINSQLANNVTQINILGKKDYRRQPKTFFGWTGVKLVKPDTGTYDTIKCGEPFVVWDADNNTWRMFYFGLNATGVFVLDATSNDLMSWTKRNINLSSTGQTDRHKIALLVDVYGSPIKINNKYHGYVVSLVGQNRAIYHWQTDNLANTWVETGIAIPPNLANNGTDSYGTDAPCAIWDEINKTVILYYMAKPLTSQAGSGFGSRINRAISSAPETGFIYNGEVIKPVTGKGTWHDGWIGGMQVLKIEKGYIVAFNGCALPSSTPGDECPPGQWGLGFLDTLYSSLKSVDSSSMSIYQDLSGLSGYTDIESVWRPNLVFNKVSNSYIAYYNTGQGTGQEWITFAEEGVLHYYNNQNNGWLVMALPTTTVTTAITNTKMILPPGKYKITATILTEQNATINHLGVHLILNLVGVTIVDRAVNMGNYSGEYHVNTAIGYASTIANNALFEAFVQVTEGTANTSSKISYYDILIEAV